jgi:DNA-binding winged helix-turn-helix (wHTH) protein
MLGPFDFDLTAHRLAYNGEQIHLRPKVYALLALLAEAAPRIVPKREIHDRLWPRGIVSDATLVAVVKELRRALGDHERDTPLIRTVHRVGYALNAPVGTATARPPVHWLVANERERYPLTDGENLVGRDPQTNVWLDYATVSRRHARLRVLDGRVVLEDLGSKNGTSVAGQVVAGAVTLRDGDRIAFGRLMVTYRNSAEGLPTLTEVSRLPIGRSLS